MADFSHQGELTSSTESQTAKRRNNMKRIYLALAALGLIVPYYFFIKFLIQYGFDLSEFTKQLFASPISTFFAVDLLISALVFWGFLYQEAQRSHITNWWVYIVATLLVGLSFAIPLFLYTREVRRESLEPGSTT
jgi:hypothetical protein